MYGKGIFERMFVDPSVGEAVGALLRRVAGVGARVGGIGIPIGSSVDGNNEIMVDLKDGNLEGDFVTRRKFEGRAVGFNEITNLLGDTDIFEGSIEREMTGLQ